MKSAWRTSSSSVVDELHAELAGPIRADERVVREELHAEREGALRHEHADPAEARRSPSVLPLSSTPSQRLRFHCPAFRSASAWGMLRAWASSSAIVCSAAESTFDCGALTTITPRLRRRLDVDVVEADPGPADDDEVAARVEHLGGDLGRAADHERGRAGDRLEELLGRQALADVDLEARGAHRVEAAGRDLLGDEHARGHGSRVSAGPRNPS